MCTWLRVLVVCLLVCLCTPTLTFAGKDDLPPQSKEEIPPKKSKKKWSCGLLMTALGLWGADFVLDYTAGKGVDEVIAWAFGAKDENPEVPVTDSLPKKNPLPKARHVDITKVAPVGERLQKLKSKMEKALTYLPKDQFGRQARKRIREALPNKTGTDADIENWWKKEIKSAMEERNKIINGRNSRNRR